MDLTENYIVVLFKNKIKRRIIKKFKTHKRAKKYFDNLVEENKNIVFGVEIENGKECKYELGLLEKTSGSLLPYFVKDELGRQIKVELEDPDYNLINIVPYKKEEFIYNVKTKERMTINKFISKYLPKTGFKLVSKINHKITIQNDEEINLFSLKNDDDCERFMDELSNYFISQKRVDTMFVKDTSFEQKKYLYDILENNGISKSILYRRFTTYKRS